MVHTPRLFGQFVRQIAHVESPRKISYEGKYVVLSPVNPEVDVEELYECSHGSYIKELVWTYMGYGPFNSILSMQKWLEEMANSNDPLFFTVKNCESEQRVGMVSFLNMASDMLRLELGHIWYSPDAQRSKVNTEAVYLLLCEAFDRLKYRRVEWKCDSLNERSRSAALRLGLKFEGVFRQHMIIKGRNRDTAWYSMLDSEWVAIKRNIEIWLYHNPDKKLSLTELNGTKD